MDKEKLQKLFYFSLKKTGNPHEAEELVQETALEIVRMLKNGYEPENFNAWMLTVIKKDMPVGAKPKRLNCQNSKLTIFLIIPKYRAAKPLKKISCIFSAEVPAWQTVEPDAKAGCKKYSSGSV
ncbi:MAG: hypothetical protein LBS21_14380 [Clostridiales bacterium]|nr:hypothetical protein [Clostridiales bacterium]